MQNGFAQRFEAWLPKLRAALYHKALTARGFTLNLADFGERFRAAYRYPCFIYMFPGIMQWKQGSEERLSKLLHRLFGDGFSFGRAK